MFIKTVLTFQLVLAIGITNAQSNITPTIQTVQSLPTISKLAIYSSE